MLQRRVAKHARCSDWQSIGRCFRREPVLLKDASNVAHAVRCVKKGYGNDVVAAEAALDDRDSRLQIYRALDTSSNASWLDVGALVGTVGVGGALMFQTLELSDRISSAAAFGVGVVAVSAWMTLVDRLWFDQRFKERARLQRAAGRIADQDSSIVE